MKHLRKIINQILYGNHIEATQEEIDLINYVLKQTRGKNKDYEISKV